MVNQTQNAYETRVILLIYFNKAYFLLKTTSREFSELPSVELTNKQKNICLFEANFIVSGLSFTQYLQTSDINTLLFLCNDYF